MSRRRIPLLLSGAVALTLVACSSDSKSPTSSATTVPRSTTTSTATSLVPGGSTSSSAPGSTSSPSSSLAPGATTTTVSGGRTVTDPADNVHLGDSGPGVEQIQKALVAKGITVAVDGQFGPRTATALRLFQQQNGLTADGISGPKTWAKLGSPTTPTTAPGATTSTAAAAASTTKKP